MNKEQAVQFIAEALGEYADTMTTLNKKLFLREAQGAITEIQKPPEKAAE